MSANTSPAVVGDFAVPPRMTGIFSLKQAAHWSGKVCKARHLSLKRT
jgi:hypothetical protein